MKSGRFSSIADDLLIRHWWSTYLWCLQRGNYDVSEFDSLTEECEKRGIIKPGLPMPIGNCKDLYTQCCEELKKRNKL